MSDHTAHEFLLTEQDESRFFAPKTWLFWRGVITAFFAMSLLGHWLEIPYCWFLDLAFGIVEPTYDVWTDPLYKPYWVYGVGAVVLTFTMLPLKVHIVRRRKTIWGALIEFFVLAVLICAFLETTLGLIINQPDQFGEYPFWNNAVLPLNILNQGWLVNDIMLGIVSVFYVWVVFPFIQKAQVIMGEKISNKLFVEVLVIFAIICIVVYVPELLGRA